MKRWYLLAAALVLSAASVSAQAARKPNILIIWGDDVGYWNVSSGGMPAVKRLVEPC